MVVDTNYFDNFFNDKVYKEEWQKSTDKEIIYEDFLKFVENLSFTDKIRIACYNSFLSSKDLFILDELRGESYIRLTLSRLNRNLNLEVKKIDGLNYYKTSNTGLKVLLTNVSSFSRENKYIKEFTKHNLNDEIFNSKEMIKAFHNFLVEYYHKEVKKVINNNLSSLNISFNELSEFDFMFTDKLLESPVECIAIMEETLKEYTQSDNNENHINIRIYDLPPSENLKIGSHRQKHINQLVSFEGLIRRKSDVKPRLKYLEYLCTNPSCNFSENKIKIPQLEEKARTLKTCPKCKSGVEILNKVLDDSMLLILEQDFNERSSDFESKKIHIKIDENLTNEKVYNKLKISGKIKVIGILRELPKPTKGGAESINYDYILEANNIIFLDDDDDILFSKDDMKQIKDFVKQKDCFKIFRNSYLPKIYDNKMIKESLILQHIGSSFENERNDSHILLLGDPSTAKTEMIIESLSYSSRFVYSSGTSSTKAGMTATAMKDELTGAWVLDPGVLPRANGGIAGLDEMDKLSAEDGDCMTEALEQQRISVNKAGISAVLQTKCSFLAGANPKHSRFDDHQTITSQINFNPALLSRFDLIFILRDIPQTVKDSKLISHILNNYVGNNEDEQQIFYNKDFLRKYIYYCKINFKPVLSEEALQLIKKYYVMIRGIVNSGAVINFTPRQIKGVIRFASAYTKFHQRNIITKDDIIYSFKLFNKVFNDLGAVNIESVEKAMCNYKGDKNEKLNI